MKEKKFLVKVRNEILGNSDHILTKNEIKKLNLVAYDLSKSAELTGKTHVSGMWSVKVLKK
jgi:hypothetical protein